MTLPSPTNWRAQRGFSFIGMVGVILMLAIGTALVLDTLSPIFATRQTRETVQRASDLRAALLRYKISHGGATAGTYPAALTALVTDDGVPCTLQNNSATTATYLTLQGWCGPYIDVVFTQDAAGYRTDGWGTAFAYVAATGVLTSCGPDRNCGATGDNLAFNP